jgi:hypothetical protein
MLVRRIHRCGTRVLGGVSGKHASQPKMSPERRRTHTKGIEHEIAHSCCSRRKKRAFVGGSFGERSGRLSMNPAYGQVGFSPQEPWPSRRWSVTPIATAAEHQPGMQGRRHQPHASCSRSTAVIDRLFAHGPAATGNSDYTHKSLVEGDFVLKFGSMRNAKGQWNEVGPPRGFRKQLRRRGAPVHLPARPRNALRSHSVSSMSAERAYFIAGRTLHCRSI